MDAPGAHNSLHLRQLGMLATILSLFILSAGCASPRDAASSTGPIAVSETSGVGTSGVSTIPTTITGAATTVDAPVSSSSSVPTYPTLDILKGSEIMTMVDGATLVAAPELDPSSVNVPTVVAKMIQQQPNLSAWASVAKVSTLYVGNYAGDALTAMKPGDSYFYWRLADGPTCRGTKIITQAPTETKPVQMTTETSNCNIGLIDSVAGTESYTLEGVK